MGYHSVPQFYLNGFAKKDTRLLYVYEKGKNIPQLLPIKNVAQEKGLYSNEIETFLAENIERPANKVLRKIRNQESISEEDKGILGQYIFVFFKRVPLAKRRFQEAAPRIANELKNRFSQSFDNLKQKHPEKSVLYEKGRRETERILKDLAEDPSEEIWQNTIPIKSKKATDYLSRMTWTFLTCEGPDIFLTNDNPVFIFKRLGINKRSSELTFPISSNVMLFATWWNIQDLSYIKADSQFIKEMNRRIAFIADRYIYSNIKREWIITLANKKNHILHLIANSKPNLF